MSTGIIGIGVSGIAAAQMSLLATEHNVSNADTPGYTRQRTVQATNIAMNTGSGSIGQGVHVQTIERQYDKYLVGQVNSAQTKLSEIDANYGEIKQIDNLLADPSAGLTPALQSFFSGVQQVAANPSLSSARQSMISSATTLVSRFQSIESRLTELSDEVNGKIQGAVTDINAYATQIADMNQRIVLSESAYGQPPNDLLDQRDLLISGLNKLVKVSTTTDLNGSLNVFIGSGQQLVVGSQAMSMVAMASSADVSKIVVGLQMVGGASFELPEDLALGGELGGLVTFRSKTLEPSSNELGRVAASMALTFNAQHALGQDLLGQANGDAGFNANFFSLTNVKPIVSPNTANVNTGLPVISATLTAPTYGPEASNGNFYTSLTSSDYMLKSLGGGNYTLTRLSDGKQMLPAPGALPATVDGVDFSVAGADVAGNSYLIQPTRNAARNVAVNPVIVADPSTVAAAAPFRTGAASSNTGSGAITPGTMVGGTKETFSVSTAPVNQLALPVGITYNATTNKLSFTWPASLATVPEVIVKSPSGVTTNPAALPLDYSAGMIISFAGMSFSISGNLNTNDSFTLSRNAAATTDGRNALSLGKLQTQNTVAGGKATLQTAYAAMVANIGAQTRELTLTGAAQEAMLNQAQAARDSLSGVNLDEEAANMIRFQQAYQASAKILEVGTKLFDTLLQLG